MARSIGPSDRDPEIGGFVAEIAVVVVVVAAAAAAMRSVAISAARRVAEETATTGEVM